MESSENLSSGVVIKRSRSASEVTVDAFRFIRDHFKNMFKIVFFIAGVPIILVSLLAVISEMSTPTTATFDISPLSMLTIVLQAVVTFVVYILGAAYLKVIARDGRPPEDLVGTLFGEFRAHGFRAIALFILVGLVTIFGAAFLILPGVYLYVALFCAGFILIYEEISVSKAFSESMELVKGYWWHTFGAILLLTVVIYGITMIVSLPTMIFFFLVGYSEATGSAMPSGFWSTLLMTLSFISSVITYFVSVISGIGAGMIFFSLSEKKEGSNIIKEISEL